MAPAGKCMIGTQVPFLLFAVLSFISGLGAFIDAHHECLYGQSSFRFESKQESHFYSGAFLMLPAFLCACCGCWVATCFAQLQVPGVPAALTLVPGVHGLFDEQAGEQRASNGGVGK